MTLRIDDFKAALIGGGARPNYFRVIPSFPGGITDTDTTGLGLSQLGSFLIKGAQLPPSTIGEIPVPFRGRQLKVAGDRIFEDWTITIDMSFDATDTIEEFSATIAFQYWTSNTTDNVG